MKILRNIICLLLISLSKLATCKTSQTLKRTPAIQPGTAYQNNQMQNPMNRNLMGMNPMGMGGMGGMNPMQNMGMNQMNPMGMGGMNPMQNMGPMGAMNPMQNMGMNNAGAWGWKQNPMGNMKRTPVNQNIR